MTPNCRKIVALAAAAGAIVIPASAQAGKVSATISLAAPSGAAPSTPVAGGSVSFSVSASAVKASDLSYLWVTTACYQNSNLIYARDMPVKNPGPTGTAGPFALDWSGGGAAQCTAFVWMFPSSSKPLAGATTNYAVSAA